VNQALEWLEANQDKPLDELLAEDKAKQEEEEEDEESKINVDSTGEAGMKSLVCNECGKQFKNADFASYHATKRYVTGQVYYRFSYSAKILTLLYPAAIPTSPNLPRRSPL